MASRACYVPPDLARRLDHATSDFLERHMARFLGRLLEGRCPAELDDAEREDLAARYELERAELDRYLALLERVGYGRPPGRRPRRERRHGEALDDRLSGVTGKLPRALALRMPTSPDTHREGPLEGEDVYGPVRCSRTLRAAHLGLLAAVGGLWGDPRRRLDERTVLCTAGELAYLLQGRRRRSGPDLAWIYGLLADHDRLELEAEVRPNAAGEEPSEAHRIPGAPIESVRRRLDGDYVSLERYAEAIAPDGNGSGRSGQDATIAITLAP